MRFVSPASLFVALAAMTPATARADEAAYDLSKGFAIGGIVAGVGVGPAITIGSTVAALTSATNTIAGDGDGDGIIYGAAGILVGVSITAIGPSIVTGSALAGNFAVRDMGGTPSLIPTWIALGGIGV